MVNKAVMDKYIVVIGEDLFEVDANDNQGAKYSAAVSFKEKYNLDNPLGEVVQYAKARVVSEPESSETTKKVLSSLRRASKASATRGDTPTYCTLCHKVNGKHDEGCPNA